MREHGQRCHDEELTHDHQLLQVRPTTPATLKLNCQMAPTWEPCKLNQQKHQVRHRAHQLERREAAMLRLVPPRTTLEDRYQTVQDKPHHQACEHHHDHTNVGLHHAQRTHRPVHLHRPTGPASTSRHHYVHFAAIGTTSA